MTFGNNLQSLRAAKGISQKELSSRIGVPVGTIAEWEADESSPNIVELSRLSNTLNISTDILLGVRMEESVVPAMHTKQEDVPALSPINGRNKKGWLIGVIFLCIAVLFAVLWSEGVFSPEPTPFSEDTARIESADASVVTIFCYNYEGELVVTGSGFLAYDSKTIITNYHVMTSAYTCKVSTNQDISYDVSKLLCYSKEYDIAILQLDKDTGLPPLTLGDSSITKKGETVVAIGSPLGIKNTVSTGVLSGRVMEDNMDVLQFTAPISSGSSGGALFDNSGNVIGITYASYNNGQNLNLAIPIELANNLFASNGIPRNLSVSTIYADEHPYVWKLSRYNDIPITPIDELLANPEKYTGKIIKVHGYISSFHSRSCYISSANHVTGDGEYDAQMNGSRPYLTLCVSLSGNAQNKSFLPTDAAPGIEVCCIGYIQYYEEVEWWGSLSMNIDLLYVPE